MLTRLLAFLLASPYALAQDTLTVQRVIDGASRVLSDGRTVRLIGIDTPEFRDHLRNKKNAEMFGIDLGHYEGYAQKAKDFVDKRFNIVKEIQLEFDPANEDINHLDKYQRQLAYAFVEVVPWSHVKEFKVPDCFVFDHERVNPQNEKDAYVDLNATLISCGYGRVYRRFDFKYTDEFLELEAEAKENKRGLWMKL